MSLLFVNTNRSVGTIHRNLYGQFAEHLGHCIYGGGPIRMAVCVQMLSVRCECYISRWTNP